MEFTYHRVVDRAGATMVFSWEVCCGPTGTTRKILGGVSVRMEVKVTTARSRVVISPAREGK